MARTDWVYPHIKKDWMKKIDTVISKTKDEFGEPKYGSRVDFIIEAIKRLLKQEGFN